MWQRTLFSRYVRKILLKYRSQRLLFQRYCCNNEGVTGSSLRSGPLAGLRILDLTRVLAGPYCTMILGDLGAEVIKVERPELGDDTRSWGPPFVGSESAYYLSVNRNKKSVAINIKEKEGQQLLQQLAMKSDVFVENYIPGKLSEVGLGYQQLRDIAPGLVYCSITGYGQTGPYAQRAGYDVIVAAIGGLTHITGPRDGEPCKVGVAMTDLSTGLYAFGSILAALWQRQKTGKGQHIDCNLLSTQAASLVNIASNYLNSGLEATRHGTAHPSIVPYQAFQSKDGYIMVGAGNNKQFQILCQCLHLNDVGQDPAYSTNRDRVANRDTLLEILQARFHSKTTKDWEMVFQGSGIPYGPINNMKDVFSDPQVLHNKMVLEMEHPTSGNIRVAGSAVKYSATDSIPCHPPPTLGQHTDDVLQTILGLDTEYINALKRQGVLQ